MCKWEALPPNGLKARPVVNDASDHRRTEAHGLPLSFSLCAGHRSDEIQMRIKRIPEKSRHAKRVAKRSATRLKGSVRVEGGGCINGSLATALGIMHLALPG